VLCVRLDWPSRRPLSARNYNVVYRIVTVLETRDLGLESQEWRHLFRPMWKYETW